MSIACSEIQLSLSLYLFKSLIPEKSEPFCPKIGKGIVLILVSPVGLIEGVVRSLFALLATLIALFLPPSESRDWYKKHIFLPLTAGSIGSLGAGLLSIPLGLGSIFDSIMSSLYDNLTNKMPPSIWCCCTKKEGVEE